MSGSCRKCGVSLEGSWKFCPHCGAAGATESLPVPQPHVHERPKARYAFGGMFFGLIAAPALIIYGGMICLLGPAMVLGIPLILLGISAPVLVPYLVVSTVRGKCPWCGAKIASVGPLDAFYCHACSKRIMVVKRELLRAE